MKKFDNKKIGLTPHELDLLTQLGSPQKIQDFVSAIPHNFERKGDSCMSVREVLRSNRAHCIEGALVAALAFWIHGERPLLLDLSANRKDDDHIIAIFSRDKHWGAISKANHNYLRYRDPIYRNIRELVISYFHEYYNSLGDKTLRSYSGAIDLTRFSPEVWITGLDAWPIAQAACDVPHFPIISKTQERLLRPIDEIQMRMTKFSDYER